MRPYEGLKVLDLSQGIAGPHAGMLLALHGADVVKVEPPEGDWSRGLGQNWEGVSIICATYNRGKRSITLDLKNPADHARATEMARKADVVLESFRPGVVGRLGLAYADVRKINPGVIYLSVSGFGQTGPYAERPCTDSVAQAYAGLAASNLGADGIPHRIGVFVCDVITGLYGFSAIQAALAGRAANGGQYIDIDLTHGTAALLSIQIAGSVAAGGTTAPVNVPAGTYRTNDGWLGLTFVREAQYVTMCEAIGRADLSTDPRYQSFASRAQHQDALIGELRTVFAAQPTTHWTAILQAKGLLADRINTPLELVSDPHMLARGSIVAHPQPGMGSITLPLTPGVRTDADLAPAPLLGQHSGEVAANPW